MSDSQSSEQLEIKAEQKIEARLRDLLEKGKLITPFYDDDTLLLIYKDCFQTDQVFLNKLEIIAKNHKQAEIVEESGWIQSKGHLKQTHGQPQRPQKKANRPKFNFLEDKALIERAKRFDPEKEREKYERRQQQIRERRDNYNKNAHRPQYKEKQDKVQTIQHSKKMKYREKQEIAPKSQLIESAPPQKLEGSNKITQRYEEKKEKIVEKPSVVATQSNEAKTTQPQKKEQKKPETKEVPSQKAPVVQPIQNKLAESATTVEQPNGSTVQQVKKPAKIQYKLKEEPSPVQQLPPKPEVRGEVKPAVTTSQKSVESPTKVQKPLDERVKQQFENSCRQNTFILKFIPPSEKLQKVSYIREPNGTYKDVKVRQVLSKN